MLNFIISTLAFSVAVYGMNRYFDTLALGRTATRTLLVVIAATLISIAAGWLVDELDGDAALHKNDPSIVDKLESGDPLQIAKVLAGFN